MQDDLIIHTQKIQDIAESNGWSIGIYKRKDGCFDVELEKFVNRYDYIIYICVNDCSVYEMVKGLSEYVESFDPDEEAMLWIGDDGHGGNGAPYSIRDILDTMDKCKEEADELLRIYKENL